jgi:cation diffusion facilitator family transporter
LSANEPTSASPEDEEHGHEHPREEHGHEHPREEHGHDHGDHDHRGGLIGFVQSIFAPHSHDSADSVDSALESSAKGIRAVKISLVALMATAAFQVVLVFVTGSVALLADTIHNFSDALTAVPLWIAFILGRRAANRRYTYGYRRAEDLAGLFIVAMIAFSALLAGWESIQRLIEPRPITNLWLVVAAGIIGFAGNELVAIYRIRVGREIGSAALVADGLHARTDGFTSLAVVAGAIGVALGFPAADPLVGLLITVAIVWILKDAVRSVFARLMDAVDPALVEQIERVADATADVQHVETVRVRWIGHRLEASLHAVVDCEMTVADGHRVAEAVRHTLFHEVHGLDYILVHIDPCEHDDSDHHAVTRGHEGSTPARPAGRDRSVATGRATPI